MLSYCLKCKKNKKQIQKKLSKNSVNSKTINGRTITLSKCAICSVKKSRFIKSKWNSK